MFRKIVFEKYCSKHFFRKIFDEQYFSKKMKNIFRQMFFEKIFFEKYFFRKQHLFRGASGEETRVDIQIDSCQVLIFSRKHHLLVFLVKL